MSALATVISTLLMKFLKKAQSFAIRLREASCPAALAALIPDPTPNQPGIICLD